MRELKILSNTKNEMIDITKEIQRLVDEEDMLKGHVIIFVPHTTAGLTINEGADPSVKFDIIEFLKKTIKEKDNYSHLEGNSDAHIKASLLGSSLIVLVDNNNLILGAWQHIFFYEGDGPRNRKIYVDFISH
jgi:secondary thiamine-phosphate synthase enzyme